MNSLAQRIKGVGRKRSACVCGWVGGGWRLIKKAWGGGGRETETEKGEGESEQERVRGGGGGEGGEVPNYSSRRGGDDIKQNVVQAGGGRDQKPQKKLTVLQARSGVHHTTPHPATPHTPHSTPRHTPLSTPTRQLTLQPGKRRGAGGRGGACRDRRGGGGEMKRVIV